MLLLTGAACSSAPTSAPNVAKSAPAVPPEYQAAAQSVLGDESEVLLSGDLAHNGHIQLLIVNRLLKMPKNVVPGLFVSRAAIVEKDTGDWHEIFLADEHLKNSDGFLAGTPLTPVTDWRLHYEQQPTGLAMYFTPLQQPGTERPVTIEVRWNPAAKRYQSLDRDFKHFLHETPSLGPTPEFLMKQ
ncbi:MAG: hypothetical protein KGL59_10725 [Acidobacteriota bacterium]|nr:hypothetical protein [Acidobacteriota bacterium]